MGVFRSKEKKKKKIIVDLWFLLIPLKAFKTLPEYKNKHYRQLCCYMFVLPVVNSLKFSQFSYHCYNKIPTS